MTNYRQLLPRRSSQLVGAERGEAGINKDEAAWWGGGNPLSQALLGMNSGSGPL